MNLSSPFILRPVMTTLVTAALLLLGLLAYEQLPVSNLPDVNYPTIQVTANLPGASPETMANTVATPLEKEFLTIAGVTNVTSTNKLGSTEINLEFDVSKDINAAAQDVEARISSAKPFLPSNLPSDPTYKKVNPSDTPILYLALTSATMPLHELYTYANTFIGQRISTVDGVAQVMTYGFPYAVRAQVDPGRLAHVGITMEEVANALDRNNPHLPSGQLDGPVRSSIIQTKGHLDSADQFEPVIVAYRNDGPVRVGDLGRVVDSVQNERVSFRYIDSKRNQPTVVLAVQRQPNANTIRVSDGINSFLPRLKSLLPASVEMVVLFDRAESIRDSIFDVKMTLLIAFLLVVLVIFLYLGKVRDTIIPSIALPTSIVGTFIAMYIFGYSIDNLSLLALTLAIGFIVDDAIVVLENIVRRVEQGESPWKASLEGSKQISFTILSMTLSLAAVFIPMLFMGGLVGKIFHEFAVTLCVVTILSGIISLTLTPMLCSRFIPPANHDKKSRFAAFSDKINNAMLEWYKPGLQWVLNHKKTALSVGALSLVLSILLFKILPTDFIPDDDIGLVISFHQAAQGTSTARMAEYQSKIITELQKEPGIDQIVSLASFTAPHEGISFLKLKPQHERKSSSEIIQGLYPKTGSIPGVNTFFRNIPLIDLSIGPASKGSFQYSLQALNPQDLYSSVEKLMAKMQEDPIFQGISSDMEITTPQLNLEVLRDRAATLGVDAKDIENTLLLAFSGNRVSRIETPLDQYDVILELKREFQHDPASLSSLYVRNRNGDQLVPLGAVAKWSEGLGPASINHISQFPAVTISFNVRPDVPLGKALERVREIASETLPPDVVGSVKGAAETFEGALKNAVPLLIFTVIAIYIVLGILYESFIHPITILSTLPPAVLGGLATLYVFHMPLSLYAYLGLILLIGIVKKNGIMVVDYALDYLHNQKESPETAVYHACLVRFRPIMMTTMAAIFGALPIALGFGTGAEARRPLGIVIIGGLMVSQLVTLFLTPVIYLYLEKLVERFQGKATGN